MSGVLASDDIQREVEAGRIVAHGATTIGNCSVDVTLGQYYWRMKTTGYPVNPWKTPVEELYDGPFKAVGEITLAPGELILAHTNEFIGGRERITTQLKARSSIGRHGIHICSCAGAGDIGYVNRWTLEIRNGSPNTITLPVGRRIGQIWFFYTNSSHAGYSGKYQSSDDVSELIKSWKPEMMLPRLSESEM